MAGDVGCSVGTQPGDQFAGFLGIADPPQLDKGLDFIGFGDIRSDEKYLAAGFLDLLDHLLAALGIARGNDCLGAFRCERMCGGAADASAELPPVINATFSLRSMRVETSLRLKFFAGVQL